jgi:hypothetical protein
MKIKGVAAFATPFSSLDYRKIVVVVFFDQVELRLAPPCTTSEASLL